MRMQHAIGLALAALIAGAGSVAAQDVQLKEEKPGLLKKAKITFEQAKTSAQAKVPAGKLESAELEEEGGKLIYTLVYRTAGKKGVDEINVDAVTGTVAPTEHESEATVAKEKAAEKAKEMKDAKKAAAKKS